MAEAKKVKIRVGRKFTLNIAGDSIEFAPGFHTVEKEIAEHWFVQAHLDDSEDVAETAADKELVALRAENSKLRDKIAAYELAEAQRIAAEAKK